MDLLVVAFLGALGLPGEGAVVPLHAPLVLLGEDGFAAQLRVVGQPHVTLLFCHGQRFLGGWKKNILFFYNSGNGCYAEDFAAIE